MADTMRSRPYAGHSCPSPSVSSRAWQERYIAAHNSRGGPASIDQRVLRIPEEIAEFLLFMPGPVAERFTEKCLTALRVVLPSPALGAQLCLTTIREQTDAVNALAALACDQSAAARARALRELDEAVAVAQATARAIREAV